MFELFGGRRYIVLVHTSSVTFPRQSHRLLPGFFALCLAGIAPATAGQNPAASAEDGLSVMTYNLRYASATGENAWPARRPLMRECIQSVAPDIIGTQEGVYAQLKDLAADLQEYEWIGLGREGGSRGEFMAVFYRRSRLEPLAFDHFWLSDTPNVVGSSSWGNQVKRMVTWVCFRDRRTQQEFYLFNTHFDHQVQVSREKSAALVRERVQALKSPLPIILTGDFNAGAGNKAHEILVGDGFFRDTWDLATEKVGEGLGTFNAFKELPRNRERIDWILVRGKATVDREEIVTFTREGKFPSDHCPVVARLRLDR